MRRRPLLRTVLARVDITTPFPRLDRGLAEAAINLHQAPMDKVILGVLSTDARVSLKATGGT